MQTTTHYALKKPDGNDTFDEANDNANMDAIDAQMYANAQAAANGIPYAVDTSAAANTVTAAITPAPASYTDGLAVCVKIANTTTGAATLNLNGLGAVAIHNGDGAAVGAGDLVAGVPVTLRYVGGATPAFIASGSGGLSGTGNATAADVLAPYTFTSASGKKQTGTMPNNGALGTIEPSIVAQNIPAGYTTGGQVAGDANLVSANIKSGTSIFGVAGKASVVDTADATAAAAQILTGQSAYVNGLKIAGSMANNGQKIITPGTAQQAIPLGYHDGTGYVKGDANLVAANIISGVSIFGVAGSFVGKQFASGTATTTALNGYVVITVSGLAFQPHTIVIGNTVGGAWSRFALFAYDMEGAYSLISNGSSMATTWGGTSTAQPYVSSSGFQLYIIQTTSEAAGNQYKWYAFGG